MLGNPSNLLQTNVVSAMKSLIILAVCAVLSEWSLGGVVALENCRFQEAQSHYRNCSYVGFNETGIVREGKLDYLRDVCRRAGRIQSCLKDYADGCVNGDLIVADGRRGLEWCDGSKLADWVIDELSPLFVDFEMQCLHPLGPGLTNCTSTLRWALNEDYNPMLEEGVSSMKRVKAELLGCFEDVFQEHAPGCSPLSWQALYNIFISYMAPGLMGMHVERSDLLILQDGDQQKRQLKQASDLERQLKRARVPFPWLPRTKF